MRRQFFLQFAAAAAAVLAAIGLPQSALAQAFPSKPIRLIVPYSPGGLPDTVARILSQRLTDVLGQSVVVDNRPGASGAVAATALALAPADGHTLLVTDGSMLAIAPLVTRRPTYDPAKDFVPVSLVGTAPLFLAAHPSVKAETLEEFIALAKSRPGTLNYGSAGTGSIHHLTAEAMKQGFGIFITHIPFRGSGSSVPAMIGGQVDLVFASPPSLMGFVKNGQARLLAVNSATRSTLAPNIPALSEKLPGFDFAFNVVVMAKTGTPREAVNRISTEIARIVKRPEVIEQLHIAGVEPSGGSPEQLAAALKAESIRVTAAAKQADLKPE